MIQKTNFRFGRMAASSPQATSQALKDASEQQWGSWATSKHYSLEVIQHPLRARMCGFGDKDRRPLAPAAVAKMIVHKEDNSFVEVDDIDVAFFVVTVDLWSADGKQDMNLVLHPSSGDRYVPAHTSHSSKPRSRRPLGSSAPPSRSDVPSSESASAVGGYSSHNHPYPTQPTASSDPSHFPQAYPQSSETSSQWNYQPHVPHPSLDRSASLPSIHSLDRTNSSTSAGSPAAHPWYNDPHRQWSQDSSSHVDANATTPGAPSSWPHPADPYNSSRYSGDTYNPAPTGDPSSYATASYDSSSQQHQSSQSSAQQPPSSPPTTSQTLPRHSYTRTLVGPLSANACRLLDEHRKPGIFFLFQDLSIRTEGTFRLRMRLMNVGATPAPDSGAQRAMTGSSQILAQTFTDPFVVYSAKRFPGVPDTTALSIAFGNQGQKLPLRNRHGSRHQPGRGRGRMSDGSDDDSDS